MARQINGNSGFAISLFDIGDCGSCMFSYACMPCALAQARTVRYFITIELN